MVGRAGIAKASVIRHCPMLKEIRLSGEPLALQNLTLGFLLAFDKMPEALGRLIALKALSLSSCAKIQDLPASQIHLAGMQELTIAACGFKKMPSMIHALMGLRTLKLCVRLELYQQFCGIQDARELATVLSAA